MTAAYRFPTVDLILIASGNAAIGPNEGAQAVLLWMDHGTMDFTLHLEPISRVVGPAVLEAQPLLADAVTEAAAVTAETRDTWAATWIGRYGEFLPVPQLSAERRAALAVERSIVATKMEKDF